MLNIYKTATDQKRSPFEKQQKSSRPPIVRRSGMMPGRKEPPRELHR
jgi:hypothetical protein